MNEETLNKGAALWLRFYQARIYSAEEQVAVLEWSHWAADNQDEAAVIRCVGRAVFLAVKGTV